MWYDLTMPGPEAEPAKKMKYASDKAKERKRDGDSARGRTRVNINEAYSRWREMREEKSCRSDSDLALLLLDFYQKREGTWRPSEEHASSPQTQVLTVKEESDCDGYEKQEGPSTPSGEDTPSPQLRVLTVKEESDSDRDDVPAEGIQ